MATTLDTEATTTTTPLGDTSTTDSFEPSAQPTSVPEGATVPPAAPIATQGLSIASLVLGIASFVFGFSFIVPAVGLVLGFLALKREPTGRTLAIVGIVTSALNLGWVLLAALGLALVLPFAGFILPWVI